MHPVRVCYLVRVRAWAGLGWDDRPWFDMHFNNTQPYWIFEYFLCICSVFSRNYWISLFGATVHFELCASSGC